MVITRRLVGALLGVLAFAGCSSGGGGGGGGSGPTINSFTATPTSLPAGGGSVTLAWNVTGATSLSIDQSVGSVTPVTTGSTSANVTATTTFTLTATDSSGNSTMTAQVSVASGPATITVSGTVIDEYGALAAGETVLITSGTFSQSAVSNATGGFSVASVPTPYNATVLDSGGAIAVQYQGLTRADPSLVDVLTLAQPRTSNLAGGFTGGTYPEPDATYSTQMVFASPQTDLESSTSLSVPSLGSTYSGSVNWVGAATTTGAIYALEIHSSGAGLPLDFPGYGTLSNVLLEDMGSLTGQNVALGPVTTGTLSGTITPPAGYSVTAKDLYLVTAPAVVLEVVFDNSAPASFSYTAPNIADTSLTLLSNITGAGGSTVSTTTGLTATSSGVAINPLAPPILSLPVASAAGVTVTTQFSWTNFTGVYLVIFKPTSGPVYYVFTTATSTTIPDLTSVGLPLPAATAYTWQILGFSAEATVDAVAVPGGIIGLELADGSIGESLTRDFTTQ
jgi:hypothetical protein